MYGVYRLLRYHYIIILLTFKFYFHEKNHVYGDIGSYDADVMWR